LAAGVGQLAAVIVGVAVESDDLRALGPGRVGGEAPPGRPEEQAPRAQRLAVPFAHQLDHLAPQPAPAPVVGALVEGHPLRAARRKAEALLALQQPLQGRVPRPPLAAPAAKRLSTSASRSSSSTVSRSLTPSSRSARAAPSRAVSLGELSSFRSVTAAPVMPADICPTALATIADRHSATRLAKSGSASLRWTVRSLRLARRAAARAVQPPARAVTRMSSALRLPRWDTVGHSHPGGRDRACI